MQFLNLIVCLILIPISHPSTAQQVTFKVDMSGEAVNSEVSIRGNVAPLSWYKDFVLTDEDGDNIYEGTVNFNGDAKNLRYKFLNGAKWELAGADNRSLWFKKEPQVVAHTYNEYNAYTPEQISKLRYTKDEIEEDVAVLKKTLEYIHPNLYKFRSKELLDQDFQNLKAEMLADPSLPNVFKSVSRFAANIQCSHTFTNLWNQGASVKKAIFYQTDKVPFTFSRIGNRLFIDRDASEEQSLEKGLEIISINGAAAGEIMERLAQYITSDGSNYEKRLQRITLSGQQKYELFDIFFPLEFGSQERFELQLQNGITKECKTVTVKALTKTKRTAILQKRYADFESKFADGWVFKLLNENTGYLKVSSFAVYNHDFDWKGFIDRSFQQLKASKANNLIIDIRGNEGGDGSVGEYMLKHVIQKPVHIPASQSTTAYRKIPEELKTYISTWDDNPYNWGWKVKKQKNGGYKMRTLLGGRGKKYKPMEDGFKGKTYLLTDAENSSATHMMASYVKKFEMATIVGQATGGNQLGSNGGYYFFTRLPNSRVEIDIPVFGIQLFPKDKTLVDGGIQPDVLVEKNVSDFINGVDTELEYVLDLIGQREN